MVPPNPTPLSAWHELAATHSSLSQQPNPAGTWLCALTQQRLLEATGPDAGTFLQGQLTCDLRDVTDGQVRLAALCTPQGRAIATLTAVALEDGFGLSMHTSLLETVQRTLAKYAVFSKVSLAADDPDSPKWARMGIWGNTAAKTLESAGITPPQAAYQRRNLETGWVVRLFGPSPRFELWCRLSAASDWIERLSEHATPASSVEWTLAAVQAGVPELSLPVSEQFVPQMLNFDALNGISYRKGCYTGQEVIARSHYRGQQKRHCYRLRLLTDQGAAPLPSAGDRVHDSSDRAVGTLVNAAPSPTGAELLAVVLDQVATPEQRLAVRCASGASLAVEILPLSYALGSSPG